MLQLVYGSDASRGFAAAELGPILYLSRLNNRDAGVTGLLLFDGRRFIQALEGEEAPVMRTFRRIGEDKRHRKVQLFARREVNCREFGNWDMASRTLEATAFSKDVEELVQGVSDLEVRARFTSFAGSSRQAA